MMTEHNRESYVTNVQGNVTGGQIGTGRHVTQTQTVVPAEVLGKEGLAQLRELVEQLRTDVVRQAPPEKVEEATGLVDEVEETLTSEGPPDLEKLEYVKSWFERNIPAAAGAVTSLVIHPLVGRLVQAAGEALVAEFRSRFGGA